MNEGREYLASKSFDDDLPGHFRFIAIIPEFSRAAVVSKAESGLDPLARYAWDGEFFASLLVPTLSSRV